MRPQSGFQSQLPIIHIIYARMALSEGDFSKARASARQAVDLASKQQDVALEAKSTLGLATALSGAKAEGRQLCLDTVEEAGRASERRLLSNAQLTLAQVLLETGDAPGALDVALRAQGEFAKAGQQDSEWRALLVRPAPAAHAAIWRKRRSTSRAPQQFSLIFNRSGGTRPLTSTSKGRTSSTLASKSTPC